MGFNGPDRFLGREGDVVEQSQYCQSCGTVYVPAEGRECPNCMIIDILDEVFIQMTEDGAEVIEGGDGGGGAADLVTAEPGREVALVRRRDGEMFTGRADVDGIVRDDDGASFSRDAYSVDGGSA